MASLIRVVVEGGGHNLYYIRYRQGEYQVFQHTVGIIWDDENSVGSANDAEDAIDLIKSHSGEEIDSISQIEA